MSDLSPRAIIAGWRTLSPFQVARMDGSPRSPVTAQVIKTELGWIAETYYPARTLRRPYPSAAAAIAALEAAVAAGPACNDWRAGPFGSERWERDTTNGRSRWGALAYQRYALVVAELPWQQDGHPVFAAFVNGEVVKVTDADWEYDHPGEPEPEDPNPFTIFDDLRDAMRETEAAAYDRWIGEPGNTLVTDGGLPGPREPEDISRAPVVVARVFSTVE